MTVCMTALMIVLSAWSRNLADSPVYYNRYMYTNMFNSFTEILYSQLVLISKSLGMDYQGFLLLAYTICIIPRVYVLSKLSRNINLVLSMYLLFPFYLDVCWLRMSLGISFVYVGFFLWLKYRKMNNRRAVVYFSIFTVIGAGFHAGILACFLIILPEYFNRRKIIIVAIITGVVGILITRDNRIYRLISLVVSEDKAKIIDSTSSHGTISSWLLYTIACIVVLFAFVEFVLRLIQRKILAEKGKGSKSSDDTIIHQIDYIQYLRKMNIMLLSLIALIPYSGSFYRIQLYLLPILYTGFSMGFRPDRKTRISKKDLRLFFVFLFGVAIVFYFHIAHTSIFESVFVPFFTNNEILGFVV